MPSNHPQRLFIVVFVQFCTKCFLQFFKIFLSPDFSLCDKTFYVIFSLIVFFLWFLIFLSPDFFLCDLPCEEKQPWEQSVSQPFFPTAKDNNFLPNNTLYLFLYSKNIYLYFKEKSICHSFQQQKINFLPNYCTCLGFQEMFLNVRFVSICRTIFLLFGICFSLQQ